MYPSRQNIPPGWAQRFLQLYCKHEIVEDLHGDLNEYFQRNVKSKGLFRARLTYILDVIKFIRPYTLRKPKFLNLLIQWIMIGSYIKTSARNMSRNKLFTGINVIGLAISMSVGLMLIAFIMELKSYDTFNKNYSKIYRVDNTYYRKGDGNDYASTSVLAGKKIKEQVTGIEEMVIMRAGFDYDVSFDDKTIPLRGVWADDSFFKVFSFDLISGDPATALQKPNSVVLTETSAIKLFNTDQATGKLVTIDSSAYTVTAVVKDPPKNSHLRFDMLGSFITIDNKNINNENKRWMSWDFMWQNYVYLVLPEKGDKDLVERQFASICAEGNKTLEHDSISMFLQPLSSVALGPDLSNQIGVSFNQFLAGILSVLGFVIIVSACFNYANLSIARSLRRMREIGIRKSSGASSTQVFQQFVIEAIIISLISLVFAFLLFYFIRPAFLGMDTEISDLVTLKPSVIIYVAFVVMAVLVGIMAGILPAYLFSKVNTASVLKDASSVRLFKNLNFRKTLIVFQFALSLGFIVAVSLANHQYKFAVAFDLGLTTENILNVELQGNKVDAITQAFSELPEVKQIARSIFVPATGTQWSGNVRYNQPEDSTTLYYNYVDEKYLALHEIPIVAGENFKPITSDNMNDAGVIINEQLLKWMDLKNPEDAIGEEVKIDGKPARVIAVVKDFHYSKISNPIRCFAFRYFGNMDPDWGGVLNLKAQSNDVPFMMNKLEAAWKKVDPIHPFEAKFYDDKIREGYDQLSGMINIIGFMAFLAISIASLGLLGMVVYTTETRMKEVSIRKVLGASVSSLLYLMSRGFVVLLLVAAIVAIPGTYILFDKVVFGNFVYRAPIGFLDLFAGAIVVFAIALLAISSQTLRVAKANPATVLKNE